MLGLGSTWKAALALTPIVAGLVATTGRLTVQPESRLWVEGTSTVRSFTCSAGVLEAEIATTRADAATAVLAEEKAITGVAVRIPAAKLDCKNGTMNSHMRKAIKAEAAPTIAFELKSYDLLRADTRLQTRLVGTLTLGGTTKDVTMTADLAQDTPGAVRVTGSYDLRMTDFGLKPPSLMLGTMKVNELVKVNFDLLLKD